MVKITADSTCDLSPEIISELDITLAPLGIVVEDTTYHDGVDIFPADVFRFVDNEGKACKTSAVNVYEYDALFRRFAERYDAVVHINIGSGFSACHQNARVAAEEFENVFVVDSQNLSSGSGHLVYEAAQMAKQGASAADICARLEYLAPRIEASFVIDRLDYLYKGGRCSALAMLGANLLQLKPCIEVVDGKMTVGKKYRGRFDNCLESYVHDRLSGRDDIVYERIFITHPLCTPETVQKVRETVATLAPFEQIIETNAGCTVSNHCGPNTLGVLFIRK